MGKILYTIIILIFQTGAYCTVTEMLSLPFDQSEAKYMIETGELDSSRWEEIEQYYIEKINVPHGELFVLRDIIPQLPQDLPVCIDDLKKYVPWNEKKIKMFFDDYPYLQPYSPILDFSYSGLKRSGKIGFSYYKSNLANKTQQSAQILINPLSQIKFQGRIKFTTEFARWQRRSLFLKPVDWFAVEIGNFNIGYDQGLIYGYFPYQDNNKLKDNWLYGKISNWNGLRIAIENKGTPLSLSTKAYFHKRLTETASGFDLKIGLSKKVWFQTGLSDLSTDLTGGNLVYIFCGSGISVSNFSSQILAVSGLANPEAVSFRYENNINIDKQKFDVEFTYLPQGYFAPRSSLIKSDFGKDVCLKPLSRSLIIAKVESQYKISSHCFSFGFKADVDQAIKNLNCFLKIKLANLRIGYKWENYGFVIDSTNHYFNCAYNFSINRFIRIETEHHFTERHENHMFYHGSIGTELTFLAHLNINPFLRIVTDKFMNLEKRMGLKQVFTPFERIYTEFVFEKSNLFSSGKRHGYAEVKAWFLF